LPTDLIVSVIDRKDILEDVFYLSVFVTTAIATSGAVDSERQL